MAQPQFPHAQATLQSDAAPEACLSLTEDWKRPLLTSAQLQGRRGVAVAIGKFDAMHTGHRALAQAAAAMGCAPCLLSFWGMAEVLSLPPRQPLVPDCERPRILQQWAAACGGVAPVQRWLPFASIRKMAPEEFVALLARDLRVAGIVVGANFRFGAREAAWPSLDATLHGLLSFATSQATCACFKARPSLHSMALFCNRQASVAVLLVPKRNVSTW